MIAPFILVLGLTLGLAYSGMLPCFLGGLVSLLL